MNKKVHLLTILLISFHILNSTNLDSANLDLPNLKLGVFDTTHNEKYRYHPFNEIAESVGFNIEYMSIAKILDLEKLDLNPYDAMLFLIDIEFLKGLQTSKASQKILQIISAFGQKPNKLIGFAVPPVGNVKVSNKALIFAPFFKFAGLNVTPYSFETPNIPDNTDTNNINLEELNKSLEMLFNAINAFLNRPLESKSFLYHTTLSNPRKTNFVINHPSQNNTYFSMLPIKHGAPIPLAPTLPYGLYFYNPIRKNQIFITSNSLLSFSGICESFHICPTNFDLRKKMHDLIQEMMWELKVFMTQNNNQINFEYIEKHQKPDLPSALSDLGNGPKNKTTNKLKKIAWMEIPIFEKDDEKSIEQQNKMIDDILKSGNDMYLWITLNPQMYFSPIAKLKNKIDTYFNSVSKFTKKLSEKSNELNVVPPEILIGYEITNNVYEPNLPKNPAIDIYGNKYFDIPSPLDQNFWDNEIKNPLNLFLEKWNNPEISNTVKIAGVVLDLEMYCRRTTGSFLATMGFPPACFEKYNKFLSKFSYLDRSYRDKKTTNSQEQFTNVRDLIKTRSVQNYFHFLENQAKNLGNNLKHFFNKKIKNCLIACYAPNISVDWFYKGLYKGLSTQKKPIDLLTFNSEFYLYKNWLNKNGIYANHSSVLMLSKLRDKKDFWWVEQILKYNDGIWLNRFSRFSEDQHNDWTSIEQSSMNKEDAYSFFENIKKTNGPSIIQVDKNN